MPLDAVADYTMQKVEPLYGHGLQRALRFMPNITIEKGALLGQISAASANEVQTLNFSGTWAEVDSFILSIAGVDGGTYSTAELVLGAGPSLAAADVKAAIEDMLEAAGYVGATVAVSGALDGSTDRAVTFGGEATNWDMPLMTVAVDTAGDGTMAVDATTAGNLTGIWGAYDDNASDGRQTARAIAVYSFRTDNLGRIAFASAGTTPENSVYNATAPAWFSGRFATKDLTGLDANAIADLGRLESGTLADGVLVMM